MKPSRLSAEVADSMLVTPLIGEPSFEEQPLGFVPMFLRPALGTALPHPKLMRERPDFGFVPRFHIPKLRAGVATSTFVIGAKTSFRLP